MIKRIPVLLLSISISLPTLFVTSSCGDDDGQSQNDAAVQQDADTQNDGAPQDGEVQPDAGQETLGCTGDSPAEPQGLGGCCNENADCSGGGACISGWCSKNCDTDADCGPTVPGPFVTGTPTRCNTNQLAFVNWCVPGSLQDCGGENDSPCPAGEVCIGGWNDDGTDRTQAFRGVCVTKMTQPGVLGAGQSQVGSTNPLEYQCEAPTYHFTGFYSRRCSHACDPANPVDLCPTDMQCSETWASQTTQGVLSGVGVCVGASCGRMEFTGDDVNDVRIPGLNDDCPTGEVCLPTGQNGADGEILNHHCFLSDPSLGQIGDDCEHSAKFDMGCDNYIYCIQAAATYTSAGAVCSVDEDCGATEVCVDHSALPSRCAPKPETGVCSAPCRTDADCPALNGAPSYCTAGAWQMPNGEEGYVTYCLAWRFVSDEPAVTCDTNADCDTDIGEGCVIIGGHSDTQVCLPHVTQDATGADCATNGVADCQAAEACVEDTDASTFQCTAVQAFGDPCDSAAEHRCLGGSCLDIEWEADDGGAATNTFCGGWCLSNADCGTDQVCDWMVLARNDHSTMDDDVADGHCRTMVVRSGAGCSGPGDCSNGDACDTTTGRCYTSTAAWGQACAQHSDCPMFGLCDTKVLSTGTCYRPGCDPANGNAGCDNTGACSDVVPVGLCLEDCTTTTDCSRSAEGFTCVGGACIMP